MREGNDITLDLALLNKLADRMLSQNEGEALSGLRAVSGMFTEKGVNLKDAVLFAASHMDMWAIKKTTPDLEKKMAVVADPGIPDCRVEGAHSIRVIRPGHKESEVFTIGGDAAVQIADICQHLKDALVVALLHKSAFKLKLVDVKDGKGQVVETILQAEYQKAGSAPVKIWAGNRGEAGILATTLRKAAAWALPDLAG